MKLGLVFALGLSACGYAGQSDASFAAEVRYYEYNRASWCIYHCMGGADGGCSNDDWMREPAGMTAWQWCVQECR